MPEISRALEGRAAGVSVQNVSGTFGTALKSGFVVLPLYMVVQTSVGGGWSYYGRRN